MRRLLWPATLLALIFLATPATPQDLSPGGAHHRVHALTGATVVPRPGARIEHATIIIRDGLIEAVGADLAVPGDALVWDMRGLTVYPGLIEPYLRLDPPPPPSDEEAKKPSGPEPLPAGGARHENLAVRADRRVVSELKLDPEKLAGLRAAGFTTALVAPARGVFRGSSALIALRNGEPREQVLRADVAQHVAFESKGEGYPNALMGAMALVRQTLLDAEHQVAARAAYAKDMLGQERPQVDVALAALAPVLSKDRPVCLEAADAQMLLRGARLLGEFDVVPWVVLGKNDAYRWLDEVADTACPLVLSLNFPPPPRWDDPSEEVSVETDALRHWHLAPRDAALLAERKARFAFTSEGLADRASWRARVRQALEAGLSEEQALAAFTTGPAALLGTPPLGVISQGVIANLTVADGPLFAKETRIVETWVDGIRYPGEPHLPSPKDLAGTWSLELGGPSGGAFTLKVAHEAGSLKANRPGEEGEALDAPSLRRDRVDLTLPPEAAQTGAPARLRLRVEGRILRGRWESKELEGQVFGRIEAAKDDEKKDDEKKDDEKKDDTPPLRLPAVAPWPPRPEPAPPAVLFKGATVWTLGPQGTLHGADLLCVGGKIAAVGKDLEAPQGALVVDAAGKHLAPGIVDCHSHSFISGRVNESSNNCTAEVRVADVVNAETVRIYQQLAGGVTTSSLLHGSANAIGGQNAVVQLRWGETAQDLLMQGAKPGIKFALGENPKRSNWGQGLPPRYPTSRMGVQESIRERFLAARDYRRELEEWQRDPDPKKIPPRIDLQLQALAEVLAGERLVHCHSYRQDEILALIRLAEEFGFRIGTFQHVLEGYKVADEIAAHGAGASTFSDWWAYKFEVYDAIAYNGALMTRRGVLVSFNSDSSEMARRLNQEAGKAVRYGGLAEDEALKLVTLNPAIQLAVGKTIGSLEPGKQADLSLWSSHPLSVAARCEQTWIAGRRYYEETKDRAAYATWTSEREALLKAARAARDSGDAIPDEGWRPSFGAVDDRQGDHSCHGEDR